MHDGEGMRRILASIALLACIGVGEVSAAGIETYSVTSIDISQGDATVYTHERAFLGLSCSSGPVGKLSGISKVSIGDTVTHGKYSFRVGIIEVSKFDKEIRIGGETIAKKGDVVCVFAANRDALPSERDCDALWVRVVNCRPLK